MTWQPEIDELKAREKLALEMAARRKSRANARAAS